MITGREHELATVSHLLDDVAGGPAVLVLVGEPGIGKTTIWHSGVEIAARLGFTTLRCRPSASDLRLSYTGLSDVLADVDVALFNNLPDPQRRALDAALLRGPSSDTAPNPRAVATGFLTLLEQRSHLCPVLLAIDDFQWLDEPSRQVVEFAVRRCRGPIAILIARREGKAVEDPFPRNPERAHTEHVGPLSQSELRQLLNTTTGMPISRSLFTHIARVSGGNPFFTLELLRSSAGAESGTFKLPDSLQSVVRDRIEQLDPPVHEVLRLVSALAQPELCIVEQAFPDYDCKVLLGVAEDNDVIQLAPNGEIRFCHPLLAAGAYAGLLPAQRRAIHLRLSSLVRDPEERARHLALATVGPDPDTVRALDDAAQHSRRRGAPATSAELLELVLQLGERSPARLVQTAQDHYSAGNPVRARELLELALADPEIGMLRAEALGLLGTIRFEIDAGRDAADLLEQAVKTASEDTGLRASLRVDLGYVLFINGRIAESMQHTEAAIAEAEQANDPGLLAEALASFAIERFLTATGPDRGALQRALELEDTTRRTPVRRWPSTIAAQIFRWTHRLDDALARFETVRQRCLDQGLENDLWFVSLGAVPAACWAGDLETARALVEDTLDRARIVDSNHALGMAHLFEAQLAAWAGDEETARRAARLASDHLAAGGASTIGLEIPAAMGLLELSLGNHHAAAGHLAPAARAAIEMHFSEPSSAQFLPDAAEALLALGQTDHAVPIIELLEASGSNPDRPWARAVGARCRGLALAASGHLDDSAAAFARALDADNSQPILRYDRARTLLALAGLQRRRNKRRAARASLQEAFDLFEQVGASGWARRTAGEMTRLGLQPAGNDDLTPSEEQVALLAATGMTNRKIATALSISPKTVEAHLTRIYQKLGIHSRAELGWLMAERVQQSTGSA